MLGGLRIRIRMGVWVQFEGCDIDEPGVDALWAQSIPCIYATVYIITTLPSIPI